MPKNIHYPLLINTYLNWQRALSNSSDYFDNSGVKFDQHVNDTLVEAVDKANRKFGKACDDNGLERSEAIQLIKEYFETMKNRGPEKSQDTQRGS